MTEQRLPDSRPLKRDHGLTSASSHPELVSGDLALPPSAAPVASWNRTLASDSSRRPLGVLGVAAIVVLLAAVVLRIGTPPADDEAEPQKFSRACQQWHLAAGAAVSRRVQSTRDSDLLQAADAVFRMRRARRNCEAGWIELACQDYHAVAAGTRGTAMISERFPCARIAEVP